jgi:hypothetical protein
VRGQARTGHGGYFGALGIEGSGEDVRGRGVRRSSGTTSLTKAGDEIEGCQLSSAKLRFALAWPASRGASKTSVRAPSSPTQRHNTDEIDMCDSVVAQGASRAS